MSKRTKLNAVEWRIIKVIVERKRFISTKKIAEKAGISWNTSDKYLHNFFDREWVIKKTRGNRTYWKARVKKE